MSGQALTNPSPSRLRRTVKTLSKAVLICLGALIAGHAIYDRFLLIRFSARISAIRAAGGAVSLAQSPPPALPPEENAFLIYREAGVALRALPSPPEDSDPMAAVFGCCSIGAKHEEYWLNAAALEALATPLEAAEPMLLRVRDAENIAGFQIPYDFRPTAPSVVRLDDLEAMQTLAEYIAAAACLAGGRGDRQAAWEWLHTGFVFADRFKEYHPLLVEITRLQISRALIKTAKTLLDQGDIPPGSVLRILEQLEDLRNRQILSAAFENERAYSLDRYAALWEPQGGIQAYVSRPWIYRNKNALLDMYECLLPAVRGNEPASRQNAYEELIRIAEKGPMMTAMVALSHLDISQRFDALEARCGLLDCALCLSVFRQERGHYPESLLELGPEAVDSSGRDLYNDSAYRYERDEDGFTLTWVDPAAVARPGRTDGARSIVWRVGQGKVRNESELSERRTVS